MKVKQTSNLKSKVKYFCTVFSIALLSGLVVTFSSCNSDDFMQDIVDENDNEDVTIVTGVKVTEEGHLSFGTENCFQNFIESVLAFENGYESGLRSASSRPSIPGFVSLSDMAFNQLRSSNDDEEMTLEEFNVMMAEKLLIDPVLRTVMDTSLRIEIGGDIFKINEFGTFSAPIYKRAEMEKAIINFDQNLITSMEAGSYTELDNGVIFTNSFGQGAVEEWVEIETVVEEEEDTLGLRSTSRSFGNNLHAPYNVSTHRWANRSMFQQWLNSLRPVSRENNFSSDRRVKVKVFNVNYRFYTSAGITVTMQRRRSFLGIRYWSQTDANRIAVGINGFTGYVRHTNPRMFSTINPTNAAIFRGVIGGTSSYWARSIVSDWGFAREFTQGMIMFTPQITLAGHTIPNAAQLNSIHNLPASELARFMRETTGVVLNPAINQRIQAADPRALYLVWGTNNTHFNRERLFMKGVRKYPANANANTRISKQTVRFHQSFGISISLGSTTNIRGFLPTRLNIDELDIFGAALYNGQWRGVRFMKY